MKNLIFLMMAILLVNVSYASEYGENQKPECHKIVQSQDGKAPASVEADDKKEKTATGK